MTHTELAKLLKALDNHAHYLGSSLRSTVGVTVPVSRCYLEKVVRNLKKLRRVGEPDAEANAPPPEPEERE